MTADSPKQNAPRMPIISGPENARKATGFFTIKSFGDIGTFESDRDEGVIRVFNQVLSSLKPSGKNSGRNMLVKVTVDQNGLPRRSIVRIVRAAPTSKSGNTDGLNGLSVALQYDDKTELEIHNTSGPIKLEIMRLPNQKLAYFEFLSGHTSQSIRITFYASVLVSGVSLLGGLTLSILQDAFTKLDWAVLFALPLIFGAGFLLGRFTEWRQKGDW